MAKQLNISFGFKADTSQARSSIQGLITDLNKLGSLNSTTNLNITPQLTEAKMAAMQLGQQLNAALNVDTGKLDLNKLNTSLRKSGMSLQDYGAKLSALGPQGQQAFSQVARSIVETEAPLRRSSGLLKEFGTTIANTARWQISSSILHGFMGALQQATGYAKALDKSLNDIRIVTDYGSDEMAKFAKQANIAAKALSTTTTEYTNASLIYFQQGLSAEEVKERTEVTIKMANAAGQSAEVVSDQMTAVWNNFADGTKSLEYYADVMTALGAATASSTDEIAGGLEKFAAIGETIGLSYEYAASALATITSNTRQSEEVVGTALKTIFARIQGLELGETLEDGVDLNKYSKALESVGINILDVTGEMKDMDVILDEMAEKWNKLSGAQQAALAQTVAGVRQYTQLIALMENWNDGSEDSMMANLSTSYGATGTLDKQAETYAESWEASKERVTAALEGVYDSILDENLFIGINDTLVDVIGMVEKMIDAMGGLPGILSVAGVLLTSIFKDDIANGINNALHNFKNFTGASKAELDTLKQKAYEYMKSLQGGSVKGQGAEAELKYTTNIFEMQKQMESVIRGANAAQREAVQEVYQLAVNYQQAAVEAAKLEEAARSRAKEERQRTSARKGYKAADSMQDMLDTADLVGGEDFLKLSKSMQAKGMEMGGVGEEVAQLKIATQAYQEAQTEFFSLTADQRKAAVKVDDPNHEIYSNYQNAIIAVRDSMDLLTESMKTNAYYFEVYESSVKSASETIAGVETGIGDLQQEFVAKGDTPASQDDIDKIRASVTTADTYGLDVADVKKELDALDQMDANASTEQIQEQWNKVISVFKQVEITAEDAAAAIKKLAQEDTTQHVADTDPEVEAAKKASDKADSKAKSVTHGAKDKKKLESKAQAAQAEYEEKLKEAKEKTRKEVKAATSDTDDYIKAIHKETKAHSSNVKMSNAAAESKKALEKAMIAAKKSAQDFGQGATTALSGTSQLSMGIFSLKSALDALKDPDLSTFEKFTQVLMSTSMGLPSLVNGFSMVKKGISEMIGAMGGSTTALLANALGLDANALAESKLNEEVLKGLGLTTTKTSLTTAEQMSLIKTVALKTLEAEAAEESNEEKAKEAGLTMANVATRLMENMALKGGISGRIASIAATIGQTLANHGLNASMVPVLAITLALTAAMLAAVAVIGAVVGAIYLIVKAYNADAQAAKDAQAQVESLTETYEECKSEAEELKATISNWQGGIEALKELDASTDEYKAKLEEVNAQARELIETYGLYDGFEVKGGVITFKEGVLEDLQDTKDERVNEVEDSLNVAKIISNNAQIKSEGTDLGRQQGYLVDKTMVNPETGQYMSRQATSSEMQSFAKVLDGIAAEKSKNLPEGEEFELNVEDVRAALESGVDGLPKIIQDNLGSISDEDIAAVINFRDSMNEAAEANRYYAEQVVQNQVENKYQDLYEKAATDEDGNVDQGLVASMTNAGTKYASENIKVDGKTMEEALGSIDVSNATSNNSLNKNYGYSIENDEDLAKQYAIQVLGWDESDFSYSGGTGEGTLTNAKEDKELTLDDDMMRQALAREAKTKEVTESFAPAMEQMNSFNTAMTNVASSAKNSAVATEVIDAAGSDGQIDFSNLIHQISPSELIDMSSDGKMEQAEIMSTLGLSLEDLQAMGIDTGEAFTNGITEALNSYNPTEFYENMKEQAAASAGSMAKAEGFSDEDVATIQEYSKHLIDMADDSDMVSDSLAENAEAAAEVAVHTAKMNRGIEKLADGFEDWNDVLKKSDKGSMEYMEAMSNMKDGLSDILGVEKDFISNDFVTEHLDDIKLAAEGNAEAIDRLAIAAAKDILINVEFKDEQAKQDALALHESLAGQLPSIEVGATLSGTDDFLAKAQEIVKTAGMSADQANAYFRSMGFETKFKMESVPTEQKTPITRTRQKIVDVGWDKESGAPYWETTTESWTDGYEVHKGSIEQIAMSTDGTPQLESVTRTNAGSMSDYSSSNSGGPPPGGGGGGGGGSKKEAEKAKRIEKDDTIERYKEIEDQLDDVRDASDEAAKAADRMYGAGKIAQMAKANALLIKEVKLLKEKKKEAEAYLRMDKNKLNQAARAAGISFTYDEKGNVTNYAEQYNKMVDAYDQMADEYDAKGTAATEEDKQKLEEAEQKIQDVEDAMSQYTDTRELIEDIDTQVTDKFYEWQDNNAEMWNYALDIAINFNEDALELLDFWLKTIEEDFYRAAEGAAVLGAEILACNASAGTYVAGLAALGAQMATGSISSEAFAEGLEKVKSGLQQTAEKIRELDDKMLHYYGDTLDKGREEIDKVTNQLEHQSSVLEHYNTLLDLMGKSTDYEAKGKVLAGQVETAKNEMIAAREEADLFARQAEDRYIDYQGSIFRTSTEMRKQQYEDALQASMETQEEYLSKAEAYAEALNATLENSLAMYGQQLENALTGGTSFDQMTVQMDRMVSLQEEYLTTTNKIYETEKLMNQAQQHIDKTTNTVAKQKLKNFINETNQLQEKTKLSQYELDIQTAKYELLLAEIALEEAQASKSQVRLQRDAEGNFGYVYTSDATQVAEAEQNYADKQNELYNLSLEGINNYAEKYQQTLQEMYEELTDIDQQYREGAFESEEEYHAARLAAQEYYFQKLEEYQDLYTIATETDANAQQDAWGSSYSEMINSTEEWKTEVIKHSELVSDSFDTWKGEMETLAEDLGLDYQTLADSVGSVTTKSNELTEELIKDGGLIDQVETQIDLVAILTNVYASLRWAVLGLAAAYSILAAALTAVAAIQAVVGIDFSGVMSLFNVLSGGAATFLSAGSGGGIITSLATAAAGLLTGFDTGGYTGEWGPYGKMAMLHEKELVLNAGDTENFLAGMKVLDNITQTIDLHSANQQLGGGMMTSPMMGEIGSDALEQSVTIEANFPSVSSRTEIEEAFTTLVNRASQYANRK